MSASLVGSEMCIRDSMRAARGVGGCGGCALGGFPTGLSLAEEGGHAGVCLLYTSDAADDM
eukprot:10828129-Alexandrium_andersonii.AAC.1